jgi:hypothetical protein
MEKQKMKIEVFSAGCFVCDPVVEMVRSLSAAECDVMVYNLSDPSESKTCRDKLEAYGIKSLPAIAVNGKLLSPHLNTEVSYDELSGAGVALSSATNHSLN